MREKDGSDREQPASPALLALLERHGHQRCARSPQASKSLPEVFPRLGDIGTEITGEGIHVAVRFVRNPTEVAMPVRFVVADDPTDAAAIREVDLQLKFHRSPAALARSLGLSTAKAKALRWKLGIDDDPSCVHVFTFGSQRHQQFSDNAFTRMREALEDLDIDDLWREYRARPAA